MKPRFTHARNTGRKFYIDVCKNLPYPINLMHLVNVLGIGLVDTNIYGEDGFIMFRSDKKRYKIVIDYSNKSLRKRFTLAHEIGHIILKHFELFNVDSLTDKEKEALDKEANVFAGELLMPYMQIKSLNCNVKSMAKLFNVTQDAMETRLKFLGYPIEEPSQMIAERTVIKYSCVEVDDQALCQLNKLEDSWLYDF